MPPFRFTALGVTIYRAVRTLVKEKESEIGTLKGEWRIKSDRLYSYQAAKGP